jgi:hypothetical protein
LAAGSSKEQIVILPPNANGLANQSNPAKADPTGDQAGKPVPEGIADVLLLVRILAAYGRHLAAIIPQRGLWRGFATVARFLAAVTMSDTIARIHRGILRAVALERVLLQCAARSRDLKPLASRVHKPRSADAPDTAWQAASDITWAWEPPAAPQPIEAPVAQESTDEPSHFSHRRPLWLDTLPSLAELEKEVRRRPVGRTITAICLDLGVSPTLCAGWFWDRLFQAMTDYRGSVVSVMQTLRRREKQFDKDDWKRPRLPLPERTREGVRQVLGFFIGEPPVDPFRLAASPYPAAALGTGPPL